ncbi:hypothetical protein [Streptomyces justiciae]|uniref:hypothetical protein n=1 Tax=Streptomyces justiciae TaxID=2780140 RepID=UPI001880E7E8|nr:hypothetical protein [Streptomyces justiciae]MBE8478120.1 hypothetical protein [Streptomyces justiciae]
MEIILDPPNGVLPVRMGMPFEEAVQAASSWGEVRVVGPLEHNPTVKIQAMGDGFDVIVILRDQETVNAVDVSAPEEEESDVRVLWRGNDVFRTPARELLKIFSAAGYEIDDSRPEEPVVRDLTIVFSRETSQEVPVDPEDGLPLYFTAALVSHENPAF